MIKLLIFQRNRGKILNRAKEYYENKKEKWLREQARIKYREISNEEKSIKRGYRRNRYQNMSEENKQRLKEYQNQWCKMNFNFSLIVYVIMHWLSYYHY